MPGERWGIFLIQMRPSPDAHFTASVWEAGLAGAPNTEHGSANGTPNDLRTCWTFFDLPDEFSDMATSAVARFVDLPGHLGTSGVQLPEGPELDQGEPRIFQGDNRSMATDSQTPQLFARKESDMTARLRALPTLAVIATTTATAVIGLAAPAHARTYDFFQSPSGNIACEMIKTDDGTGFATCKLKDHAWEAPPAPGGDCEDSGADLKLDQGARPCVGFWPSQIFLLQDPQYGGGLQTLAYGQTRSAGTITCTSEPSGVRCADRSTEHFFRVSRESYELG
jgi:hypothetical protein